jgi:hypothetical protein
VTLNSSIYRHILSRTSSGINRVRYRGCHTRGGGRRLHPRSFAGIPTKVVANEKCRQTVTSFPPGITHSQIKASPFPFNIIQTPYRPYLPSIRCRHALMGIEEAIYVRQRESKSRHHRQALRPVPKAPPGATGPKTEASELRSSLNAYKHGITGQIHVFTAEEHEVSKNTAMPSSKPLPPGHSRTGPRPIHRRRQMARNRARALEAGILAFGQLLELVDPPT